MNIDDEYKKWAEEQIHNCEKHGWRDYAEYLHSKVDIMERHIGLTIRFLIENKDWLGLDENLFTEKQTEQLSGNARKRKKETVSDTEIAGLKNTLMFDKIECLGNCEKCKYREGTCCLASSRFGSEKPSAKQIKFAESIAKTLNVALPICKKKIPYGAFISSNKNDFEYARATRVWQRDF